jgi:hypothetical protein
MVLADVACEIHWLDDRSHFFPFFLSLLSLPRSCPKGPLCEVDPVGADENVVTYAASGCDDLANGETGGRRMTAGE